jgi:peroxiredoxin
MRKLSAIMLALLLVSGVAMAQDVSFSGTVDWTQVMATDGDDKAAASVDVKLTAMVDDYNTAVIKYEEQVFETDEVYGVKIKDAFFTTDWAGAFGLDQMAPVGIDSTVGYFESNVANVSKVTGLGYEDVDDWFGDAGNRSWNYQVVVSAMDMVNFKVAVDPGPSGALESGNANTTIGAYGGADLAFGTIDAEIFFYDVDDAEGLDAGYFLFGAAYSGEAVPDLLDLGVGLEFVYDTDAADLFTYEGDEASLDFGWGLGVSGTVMDMATLGLSVVGHSEAVAGGMGIDLNVAPIELIEFDLGVALVIDEMFGVDTDTGIVGVEDQETLDMLEASVLLNLGAADFRVGYLYDGTDDTDAGLSGNLDDKYKSDVGLPGTSAGAIFIRTTLNY